jgi:hypothetical protein
MAFKPINVKGVQVNDAFPFLVKSGKYDLSTTEEKEFDSGFRALTGGDLKTKLVDLGKVLFVLQQTGLDKNFVKNDLLTFPPKAMLIVSSRKLSIVQE